MTKGEIKVYFPYLKALAEDKEIQCDISGEWKDIEEISFSIGAEHYRVRPESEYRPFETLDECWNEMLQHQPFGWIKNNVGNLFNIIAMYNNNTVKLNECYNNYYELFKGCKFIDGTPFGTKL